MKMLLLYSPFKLLEEGIVSLLLLIDSKIYGLFAKLYSLYLQLARAEIFEIDTFDNVIKNIYVLFGVVALFIIAFSLLQAMVNPENISKGAKTTKDIIMRLILCVGLTCITPFVFDFLYDVQNSILSYGSITKIFVGDNVSDTTSVDYTYKDISGNETTETVTASNDEINKNKLQIYGNQMAFYVLSGFLYTNDTDGDGVSNDVVVDASKYFDTGTGWTAAGITCGVAVVGTVVLALTGVLAPVSVGTGTVAAGACIAAGAISLTVNGVLIELTAEKFSWNVVSTSLIQVMGEFDYITAFSEAVLDGRMSYTPIVSTVAGIILLYMLFSFCLDLGVRAAKLVFYQIMAPISFLLSILPKNKDLMANWFKAVLTTWAEVFIRIACVLGAALLISNLNFTSLNGFGLVARAIIVLGIVTFVKQVPKLFSEITGIKSGDMKLGIKDKLAAGGAFVAGGIVGGALTGGIRNATNAIANGKNKWKGASVKEKAGLIAKGFGSTIAGTTSGAYNSGRNGLKAKNFAEMKNAASKGGIAAVKNRENRIDRNNRYKANDKSWAQNFVGGHVLDAWEDIKDYATGGASKYDTIISTGGKFDKQWSKVKSTAGDIKKKKLSDSNKFFEEHIATKMNDEYFKGSNSGEMKSLFERLVSDGTVRNMRELEEYYTSLNNKQIESDAFIKYDEDAYTRAVNVAASSVDRKQFETTTGILDANGNSIVKFDEKGYKMAVENAKSNISREKFRAGIDQIAFENAQRELNTEKSLVASMIAQIDKKSTEEVIDLTGSKALEYGLGSSDYLEIKAQKDAFTEMFKASGGKVTPIDENGNPQQVKDSSGKVVDKVIDDVSSASNMKAAAEAYKDLASKASGEAKRIEIKKEARKKDDK